MSLTFVLLLLVAAASAFPTDFKPDSVVAVKCQVVDNAEIQVKDINYKKYYLCQIDNDHGYLMVLSDAYYGDSVEGYLDKDASLRVYQPRTQKGLIPFLGGSGAASQASSHAGNVGGGLSLLGGLVNVQGSASGAAAQSSSIAGSGAAGLIPV